MTIQELIAESRELEETARRIQQGRRVGLSQARIQELVDRYHRWYDDCLRALPTDLHDRFRNEYQAKWALTLDIKDFLGRPTEPNPLYDTTKEGFQLVDYWLYPYERAFRDRLWTQRDILQEAARRLDAEGAVRPIVSSGANVEAHVEPRKAPDPGAVFVVHGRNMAAYEALLSFLRALGLKPIEWSQVLRATAKPSPYIGEILDAGFALAQAVLVLMTPDDEGRLREAFHKPNDPQHERELTGQARQNVVFEAGMAWQRDHDRTVLVELGYVRPLSDISGIHVVRLDDSTEKRQELAHRIEMAGCSVDLTGTSWHKAGEFEKSIAQDLQ